MELQALLLWLVSKGAFAIAFALMEWLPWPWFQALLPRWKRVAAFALTGVIAIGAYLLQIVMLYEPAPGAWPADWRAWVAKLVVVATSAFGLATLLHTLAMSNEPKAVVPPEPDLGPLPPLP